MNPKSLLINTLECILHDPRVLFSESWNFYRLKRKDPNSGEGDQLCRKSELFGPPFYTSTLKDLRTQFLCHSLDCNAFCLIQEYLCETFMKFLQIKVEWPNFCGKPILQKFWIIWSLFLSFIRFIWSPL